MPENGAGSGWLVVEDGLLIAILIEDALGDLNIPVLGPAGTVAQALALIDGHSIEGALLDVNLGGQPIYPVAQALSARGIPFAFVTGYGEHGVGREFADRPVLRKPFAIENIHHTVRQLRAGRAAQAPHPAG